MFPNPNAPTGEELSLEAIERILDSNRGSVVIVDEAYVDSGRPQPCRCWRSMRTFWWFRPFPSPGSMAGMRIGFCIGNEELIACLNDVKYSFNSYTMDQTALILGTAALRDGNILRKQGRRSSKPGMGQDGT